MLLFTCILQYRTNAQSSEVSTNPEININSINEIPEEQNNNYIGSLVSDQYVSKFSEFTGKLASANLMQIKNITQIKSLEKSLKKAKSAEKKSLKTKIKKLKIIEQNIEEQIVLIKEALKLLQNNKSLPDADKLITITNVKEIEEKIKLLNYTFQNNQPEEQFKYFQIEKQNTYTASKNIDCKIVFDGIDPQSKKAKKELEKEFLFGYTHPKLKSYFKDKNFLTCETQLIQLNNKSYMWLYITIASKDAVKNYGLIEINSTLKIELIDGSILYIPNAQNSSGKLEAYTANTLYQVILPLDKTMLKQLEKSEIDKIGIMWSSGYEQYEVYEVDIVMNQIACLKNK